MDCGDHVLDRVVAEDGADTDLVGELELVRRAEEGLVLADRLALVVENGPAAADPARISHWRIGIIQVEWPGLGLDLLLDLAAKAIGIAEADLDLQPIREDRVAGVSLPGQRGAQGG